VAFILFWTVYALSILWQLLLPPDVIEQQTELSGLIADNIETLSTAFWVAFTAAIGEEIAFRGALQPIFGNWLTSAVFALTHTQYAFTPALGIIFVVSLGFGWARQRYNTTVAIVAHFVYNFALAALVVFGRYALDVLEMMP
jgi:membrane protease YdiL (CAAX protease family)